MHRKYSKEWLSRFKKNTTFTFRIITEQRRCFKPAINITCKPDRARRKNRRTFTGVEKQSEQPMLITRKVATRLPSGPVLVCSKNSCNDFFFTLSLTPIVCGIICKRDKLRESEINRSSVFPRFFRWLHALENVRRSI